MDVTASRAVFGDGETIARSLKDRVLDESGLVVSVGVATNKLCAKVASDLRKPDALVVVPPGGEAAFLAPLPVTRLWGVGPQTRQTLADYGVATIGQLAAMPEGTLRRRFGIHGAELRLRALRCRSVQGQLRPGAEVDRPRADLQPRRHRSRATGGDAAGPGRVGRQPAPQSPHGGRSGAAQAALRGLRHASPARRRCGHQVRDSEAALPAGRQPPAQGADRQSGRCG